MALAEGLVDLAAAGQAIASSATALTDAIAGLSPSDTSALIAPLAADLLDGLAVSLLRRRAMRALLVLQILGLVAESTPTPLSSGGNTPLLQRVEMPRQGLDPSALGPLLSDPGAHLRQRLGFEGAADQAEAENIIRSTFLPLAQLAEEFGAVTAVGLNEAPTTDEDRLSARSAGFVFTLPGDSLDPGLTTWFALQAEVRPASLGTAGLALTPSGGFTYSHVLGGGELTAGMTGSPGVVLFPAGGGDPQLSTATAEGIEFSLSYTRTSATGSAIILGTETVGLIVEGLNAGARVRFGRDGAANLDVVLKAALDKAAFVIAAGPDDGFLATVLPPDGLRMDLALGVEWSTLQGLRFSGAGSLEADLPIHLDILGIVMIEVVHLLIGADENGLKARVAADIDLAIGPIAATIQGMGVEATVTPTEPVAGAATGGNLGPMDIDVRFKPPSGVGLVLDAAAVKGAGFILNDPEKGRYAGALELRIADVVSVTALGVVTTKLPDGSEGFSMLVIITATFPPIQLGFGFSLSGLGGIVGIHRTMDLPALRDRVRTKALDSILFPVDPVGRITQVLSDVEAVFPSAQGRFTAGIMARLGWGSPQLVTVDLGLIISLPAPISIALIGRVIAVLPDADAAVVILQIDVAGGLDLGRNELWIEASLHDSRVALFEISGGLAVRTAWGDDPTFLISVGGFNPHFTPPAGFTPPERVAISLANSENLRVRLEAYLAITSNTLQTGARLDAHAEFTFLGVWSADIYAGFDALITFVPFSFIVDVSGGVQIKHDGDPFLGASFLISLSGPQPLRALGYAELEFFGTHRIPIDVTVGEDPVQAAIAATDPRDLLAAAIADPNSWNALPPADAPAVITRQDTGNAVFAHPQGSLGFRQRVVPLDVPVERFGGLPLATGQTTYSLTYQFGTRATTHGEQCRDAFAPAQFLTVSEAEKLSLPSFTQMPSGVSGLAVADESHGTAVVMPSDDIETSLIDAEEWRPVRTGAHPVSDDVMALSVRVLASAEQPAFVGTPMKVSVADPSFAVASGTTMAPAGVYDSWVEARAAAAGSHDLQVVDAHEVA